MEFLAIRPSAIDRVINVPALTGVNNAVETKGEVQSAGAGFGSVEVELFYETMRAEKFDLVIHMQGDGKAVNPFINKLGGSLTAGMRNPPAEHIDRSIPYVHYQSEVLRNLEIAALVGARTTNLEPQINVTGADEQEAAYIRESSRGSLMPCSMRVLMISAAYGRRINLLL